jgi:hypothetical protein
MPAASHCDGFLPNAAFTGANELNGGVVFYRSIQQKLKHNCFRQQYPVRRCGFLP